MSRSRGPVGVVVGATMLIAGGCGVSPEAVSNPQPVDAASYGDAWPLTVRSGVVACTIKGSVSIITFTASGGGVYALNGSAEAAGRPNVDAIAAPHSATTMWTLRSLGVRVCTAPR